LLLPLLIIASVFPSVVAAQARRRAVRAPSNQQVVVTGTVTDADTGAPVVAAEIIGGGHFGTTGNDGTFQIQLTAGSPVSLEARRTGYESTTRTVTPTSGTPVNFTLKSKPTIRVRNTAGETRILDGGTAEWAYLVPFSGYVRGKESKFCKTDGSSVTVNVDDVTKITGPSTSATNPCCTTGPMTGITATLRSGETTQLFFQDSCFGFSMDFLGRDHATAQFVYLKFAEIAEIVLP
jgi:hypothetical protein